MFVRTILAPGTAGRVKIVLDAIIPRDIAPDYLNDFFVNIADRTRNGVVNPNVDYGECYNAILSKCDFVPLAVEDLYVYMLDIDVNSSSCITGINSKICKLLLDKLPDKFTHLFANSLFNGKFPEA